MRRSCTSRAATSRLPSSIKQRVRIPVIAVGRIEPAEADAIVRDGKADFVAMARGLLADPALPRKLAEGRPEDVRPCIYCYTCVGQDLPERARRLRGESRDRARGRVRDLPRAKRPRRVLVVGGGPAGMEAARIAALRGHRVTLCEKSQRLGGTLLFSSLVYEPNGRLVRASRDAGAKGRRRDPARRRGDAGRSVREIAPDVVLVATGARREAPAIPGAERANVLSGDDLRSLLTGSDPDVAREKLSFVQRAVIGAGRLVGATQDVALARELSRRWMPLGRRVVIVGGGLVGVELAEFLSEREREVTVLEEGATLAPEMALPRRWRALFEAREHGVRFVTRARVAGDRRRRSALCRRVRPAQERARRPRDPRRGCARGPLARGGARGLGIEVHLLGDCDGVGYIEGAMLGAARVARESLTTLRRPAALQASTSSASRPAETAF